MTTPSWFSVKPVGGPCVVDGMVQVTLNFKCRWWSISFLRWLRAQLVVEPKILAWPITVWFFLRWRLSVWRRARS